MNFHAYTTTREACKRSGAIDDPEEFYRVARADAVKMGSSQFVGQLQNERDWEKARRPYYNVWPSIVPMLSIPSPGYRRGAPPTSVCRSPSRW
jgi:hypothetical protein